MTWTATRLAIWATACCQRLRPTCCKLEWATLSTGCTPCKTPTSPPDPWFFHLIWAALGVEGGEWRGGARPIHWAELFGPRNTNKACEAVRPVRDYSWALRIEPGWTLLHCLSHAPHPMSSWWAVSYCVAVRLASCSLCLNCRALHLVDTPSTKVGGLAYGKVFVLWGCFFSTFIDMEISLLWNVLMYRLAMKKTNPLN